MVSIQNHNLDKVSINHLRGGIKKAELEILWIGLMQQPCAADPKPGGRGAGSWAPV
jgi:hypothetical protein